MDPNVAAVLLKNLLNRIEIQDDGSGTLTGRLTIDELAALRTATELTHGTATAAASAIGEQPMPAETQSSSVPVREVDRNHAGGVSEEISSMTGVQVKLNFDALGQREVPIDGRICLDFGTAMSKATLVVDGSDTEREEIRVLPLGIPGNQEEVSDTMLISSVYIDNEGTLHFGKSAVDHSMPEGTDGSRGRLDNIERQLSEDGWDEWVDERFNPTGLSVSYGDMVLAYLSFLTWTTNRCLDDLGYPHNMPRRFAVPCFMGEKRREVLHRLKDLVGEAQILADTFGSELHDGVPLRDFVCAIGTLRTTTRRYPYVLGDVVEPLGVANSILSWTTPINSLVLVIDIGAGTSDLSLYRLNVVPDGSQSVGMEVEGSARVLTEAGNHLDRLLIALIVKKSGINSDDGRWENVHSALELRIREFKESLFQEEFVFVALENWIEVEIALKESLELEAVRQFGENLRRTMIDILESVDESWVNWIRASPQRFLTVVLTGGGAELPMVKDLAERTISVNGAKIPVRKALRFPPWLRDMDPNLETDYPRVAVSLGGGRRRLIEREGVARVTGGDISRPPTLGGYFQKGK